MTAETFLKRHGEQWSAFRRDPMYPDLVELLRSFDPARQMDKVTAKDATENSEHLLGRIAGFNLAINAFTILEPAEQLPPLETHYEEQPDEP